MVAHCFQFKFESSPQPHLHYDTALKFETEIKNEIDFYYHFYFAFHLLCWLIQILLI